MVVTKEMRYANQFIIKAAEETNQSKENIIGLIAIEYAEDYYNKLKREEDITND